MWRRFNKKLRTALGRPKLYEIEPDEIFLDASNLPEFNTHQFEGRIETPISKRIFYLLGVSFLLLLLVAVGKLWQLQIARGAELSLQSEENRLSHSLIFAERGVIYDRTGEELAWNAPGEEFARRVYAPISGIAHVVGFVSYPKRDASGVYYQEELVGRDGVENSSDKLLAGENGLKIIETDALGKIKSQSTIRPPQVGENITLTIDAKVQRALSKAIERVAREQNFVGGAGVILDVTTGEILALTSVPEYDPNILTEGENKNAIAELVQNPREPFLNRAVSGLYTPGSTVKPFLASGALNEGVITPEKQILSTGSIAIPHPYFEDQESVFVDWKAHGWVDMRQAIAVSSNVYFYEVGGGFEDQPGLGIDRIAEYMRLFGFGAPTGVELAGEQEGTIPTPAWKAVHFEGDEWRVGDTYNTAIGQYGFQVTPLQSARAIAAVANGGKLIVPVLLRGERGAVAEIGIPDKDLQVVREGMERSVSGGGTAAGLSNPYVAIAAKTGTAQVGVANEFSNSWVVGFFPYENPRFSFALLMEKAPAGTLVGAPAAMREFIEWMGSNAPEYFALEKD